MRVIHVCANAVSPGGKGLQGMAKSGSEKDGGRDGGWVGETKREQETEQGSMKEEAIGKPKSGLALKTSKKCVNVYE